VKHAFSSVADGNMSFKRGEAKIVVQNRLAFLKKHNLQPNNVVSSAIEGDLQPRLVTTVHAGAGVTNPYQAIPGHALFTTKPNLPLMLLTADCIPVIIYSTKTPLLSVIHLSANTLDKGVLKNTVEALKQHVKTDSAHFKVILGPHIKVESYHHAVPPHLSHDCWQTAITPHGIHKVAVNLTKATIIQLIDLGITSDNITIHPSDTNTDPMYFSHYRSHNNKEPEGRFATVAWIEEVKPHHA
jgi:copper oxidase (laccase) domain-containing protein